MSSLEFWVKKHITFWGKQEDGKRMAPQNGVIKCCNLNQTNVFLTDARPNETGNTFHTNEFAVT